MILVGRGWTYSGRFIPDDRPAIPHRDEIRWPTARIEGWMREHVNEVDAP